MTTLMQNKDTPLPVDDLLPQEHLQALVTATQRGERAAFEDLYRRTYPSTRRLVLSLVNDPGTTDDLVQETYLTVWTKIRALREPATFWTWLRRIAVHLSLRRREQSEKKGWNRLVDPNQHQPASSEEDPGTRLPARLDLAAGLSALPETDRAILILREVHGCAYEEMAAILSIPVGTVRSRLHGARKKILKQLQEAQA